MNDTATFAAYPTHCSGRALPEYLSGHLGRALRDVLGSTLYGSFNVTVEQEAFDIVSNWPRTRKVVMRETPVGVPPCVMDLYLCAVRVEGVSRPAWILRDPGYGSSKKGYGVSLAICSREPLPTDFQAEQIDVTLFSQWGPKRIDTWAKPRKWFQTFGWSPRCRANSAIVWKVIEGVTSVAGRTLLDIGCSSGYHTIKAAQAGAIATGVDRSRPMLETARTIARHIERSDARFEHVNDAPNIPYDVILYLSVAQYESQDYSLLKERMRGLRRRCHDLFVEVILPPLKGDMSPNRVERIIGGERLMAYEHRLHGRRERRLYHVRGLA